MQERHKLSDNIVSSLYNCFSLKSRYESCFTTIDIALGS